MAQTVFDVLVVLHALTALAAFSSVGFAGTYCTRAGRLLSGSRGEGDETAQELEELQRYFTRPAPLAWGVLAVPVLGYLALQVQPHGRFAGQTWPYLALGVWGMTAIIMLKSFVPAVGRLRALMSQAYPLPVEAGQGAELAPPVPLEAVDARQAERAGRAGSWSAAACDCLFFVALALMIWQPNW